MKLPRFNSEILTPWKSSDSVWKASDLPHPSPLPLGEGESLFAPGKSGIFGLSSDWLEGSLSQRERAGVRERLKQLPHASKISPAGQDFCNSFRTLWGILLVLFAGFIFQGCSGSNSKAPGESPAADIRGAPINSPVAVSTQSLSAAAAGILTNTPNTEPATTNAVASSSIQQHAGQLKPADGAAEEFTPVSFEKLASFAFEIPDEQQATNKVINASKSESQIPAAVKALDQKRVALKGFMLPLKVESGLVTEMLIMRDQSMCCYGTVPKINEWVSIKMTDKGVKAIMDQPVTIFGKLRVGEIRENGYLVGIYQMDGEKMAGPLDL